MPDQLQSFLNQEDEILKRKVESIKSVGANVLFAQRGIDDLVSFYLAKEGIYAISRVPKDDMQKLSKATGARIVSKLSEIGENDLGFAESVNGGEEEEMTYVMGCKNPKGPYYFD